MLYPVSLSDSTTIPAPIPLPEKRIDKIEKPGNWPPPPPPPPPDKGPAKK